VELPEASIIMSAPSPVANADPFGLQMLKPTKSGGQVWFIYNTDFNDDPQVYTESASLEYLVHNVVDVDGTRFSISKDDVFKCYISPSTGLDNTKCITDQQEMARRGYMQSPQDWRNVEFTGQFVVFKESTTDFITFGFRGGRHVGNGSPAGCTGSSYLVEIAMTHGGMIRVRKESWNISIHNWLSQVVSGFDSTKVCGWSLKILVYNTQDSNGVNVEVWLAPQNDNHFTKVLSGVDTGQINTDAPTCNCTVAGQPLTWGAPAIMMQGTGGTFGFKNLTIREIEGYGATLPPIDPGTGGGTGTGGTGGGTGSGTGSGTGGGGGGVPVDLTPIVATPKTNYVQYGGGPQFNPLEWYIIFAGADWNKAPPTSGTPSTVTATPTFSTPSTNYVQYGGGPNYDPLEVWFIFAGASWNGSSNTTLKNNIMSAMSKLFSSFYFEGALQYGNTNKPILKGSYVLTAWGSALNITELPTYYDNVDAYIVTQNIIYGDVPAVPFATASKRNIAYFILAPPGKHITMDGTAGTEVGGWHTTVSNYDDSSHTFLFDIIGSIACNGTLDDLTYGISHELIEMVTDVIQRDEDAGIMVDFAGYTIKDGTPLDSVVASNGGPELADVCLVDSAHRGHVNGVTVAPYWSDQDGSCIVPIGKLPWVKCPTGYTYDPVDQLCKKTTTTGPPSTNDMANTTLKTQTQNAITAIFGSNYFKGLLQYGLTKSPTIAGFVVNTVTPFPPNYTEANINTYIDDCIAKNLVPANSASGKKTIAYLVVLPPHTKTSNGNFGFQTTRLLPSGATTPTYYYITGVVSLNQNFDDFTRIISQTLIDLTAENNTNGKGYHIKPGTSLDPKIALYGDGLADVCLGDSTNAVVSGNIVVAKYWSDQDGACIIPPSSSNPTPWISCHTGAVFDNVTQSCKALPSSGGGGTTPPGGPQGYTIAAATASSDDGHVPAQAIDGKLDTRWSGFGKGQWLKLDLGTTLKPVDKVKIAWYQGDQRSNKFEIHTSIDGTTFTKQVGMDSVKGSTGLTDYAITPVTAPIRYVKIIVNGNTQNDWASISEVEIWGPGVAGTTPGTGTGGDPGSGGTTPGGDTGGGTQTPPPATTANYNFFDTSFSVDYHKIGLCNPVE
jgi:hypothetical protein